MNKKKIKKILTSPVVTLLAFVAAAGLLLFSSVGGARAALTYYSETYSSNVELSEIGVALMENGQPVSMGVSREGSQLLLPDVGQEVVLGKVYTEELAVMNVGDINQFVRVTIHKYWQVPGEEEGTWVKTQELNPDLIQLNLRLTDGWMEDENARTASHERTVLYYDRALKCGDENTQGEITSLFADTLTISGETAKVVKQEEAGGVIKTTYAYDGARFCIEVRVDAVQEHNAEAAILSAWGRSVTVTDGRLSLN